MRTVTFLVPILSLTAACSTAAYAAGDVNAGKTAYESRCKSCHGEKGVANPAIVKMMKTQIPDLGSSAVQKLTDKELEKVITQGKGKMPAIRTLQGKAVDEVVAYMRTLKK